jgi:hypothetical protein
VINRIPLEYPLSITVHNLYDTTPLKAKLVASAGRICELFDVLDEMDAAASGCDLLTSAYFPLA